MSADCVFGFQGRDEIIIIIIIVGFVSILRYINTTIIIIIIIIMRLSPRRESPGTGMGRHLKSARQGITKVVGMPA